MKKAPHVLSVRITGFSRGAPSYIDTLGCKTPPRVTRYQPSMKPAKVKVITPPNGVVQMCGAMVASAASMEHPHGAASQAAWDEMRIFFTKKMVENAMDFVS